MVFQKSPIATEKKLTEKEQRFVTEYLSGLNATQAAIRAKYSQKSANVIGYQLLNKEYIKNAINKMRPEIIAIETKKYNDDRKNKPGYIYLIKCSGFDFYRIGRAIDMQARLNTLQCEIPFKLEVLKTIEIFQAPNIRLQIFTRYRSNLIRGEWFKFTHKEILDVISYLDGLLPVTVK